MRLRTTTEAQKTSAGSNPAAPRKRSVSGARGLQSSSNVIAERGQPLHRLVAEHEANVAVGDLTAPAPHGRCGDLLLEQAIGDLEAVEAERSDVEEQRPGPRRPDDGKALELAECLVASSLTLRIGGMKMVVGQAERIPSNQAR